MGWPDPPVNFLGIHTHGHQHQKSFLLNIVSNARWLLFCDIPISTGYVLTLPKWGKTYLRYKPTVHGHVWCRDLNRSLIVCESVECWLPTRGRRCRYNTGAIAAVTSSGHCTQAMYQQTRKVILQAMAFWGNWGIFWGIVQIVRREST